MKFGGPVAKVHVDRHAPELQRRVERLEVFGTVREVDGDLVAGHDAGLGLEMPRQATGAVGEFGPGHPT